MSCFKYRLHLPEDDFGKQLSRLVLQAGGIMNGYKASTKIIKVWDQYPPLTKTTIKFLLLDHYKYSIWPTCC